MSEVGVSTAIDKQPYPSDQQPAERLEKFLAHDDEKHPNDRVLDDDWARMDLRSLLGEHADLRRRLQEAVIFLGSREFSSMPRLTAVPFLLGILLEERMFDRVRSYAEEPSDD